MRTLFLLPLALSIVGPALAQDAPPPPVPAPSPSTFFPDSLAAPAGPFFVVAGSFRSKASAQQVAHRIGAWVLRSDLYAGMTPGHYAVVFGPYADRRDAEAQQAASGVPEAYVRTAGPPMLPAFLGDAALLSALLGEIAADVQDRPGGDAPCAPDEPYVEVKLAVLDPAPPAPRTPPDTLAATDSLAPPVPPAQLERRPMGVRGFWVVRRTGEVRRIESGCAGG
jgi:hypothetical protein